MPATAGIHLRFRWQANEDLDSDLYRNGEKKSRLLGDDFRTPRLGAEGHSVDPRQLAGWSYSASARAPITGQT